MPAADAARAVIGPDDPAAARVMVSGIIAAVIIAPVEVAMAVMRPIDPVAMESAVAVNAAITVKPAVAIAAAVEGRRGAEAADMAAMESTAAKTADMSSATAEAAATVKMSAAMTTAAVANLRDEAVARGLTRALGRL